VIPRDAVVTKQPIHGLDTEPARAFVAALDDPALPLAEMAWQGNSNFTVHAPVKRGQAVVVQVTWVPGWEARVNGRRVPVRGDGLGQMVLEPTCDGDCTIAVSFEDTTEAWVCRILSGLVTLGLLGASALWVYERR
jgi:hypothetical protein